MTYSIFGALNHDYYYHYYLLINIIHIIYVLVSVVDILRFAYCHAFIFAFT